MNYRHPFDGLFDDEEQVSWIVRWSPLIGLLIVIGFGLVCMYGL